MVDSRNEDQAGGTSGSMRSCQCCDSVPGEGMDLPGVARGAVTFRLFASAREAAGTGQVRVSSGTVPEALEQLCKMLPPRFGEILAVSSLLCDGFRLDPGCSQRLPDDAVVDVLPPFAGG